jgi:hypothetical protein
VSRTAATDVRTRIWGVAIETADSAIPAAARTAERGELAAFADSMFAIDPADALLGRPATA